MRGARTARGVDLVGDSENLLEHRRAQLRTSRDGALRAVASTCRTGGSPARGGLNLWCELPRALSSALVPHAAGHGVLLAPGPRFAPEGGLDRFVRLPYTQPHHVLTEAIARLAGAWQETLGDPGYVAGQATLGRLSAMSAGRLLLLGRG